MKLRIVHGRRVQRREVGTSDVKVRAIDSAIGIEEATDRGGRWHRSGGDYCSEFHAGPSERGQKTVKQDRDLTDEISTRPWMIR